MLPSSLEILPRARNQLRIATWVLAAEGTSAGASGGGVNQNFCCPKTKTDFQSSPTTPSAAVVKSTMEVIGNVISGAKELYDSTNKANLSGAIDVVVVKQVSTVLWCAAQQHSPKSIHLRLLRLNQFIGANLLATGSIFPFFFLSCWCLRLDWIGCTQPCSFAALTHVDLLHNEH